MTGRGIDQVLPFPGDPVLYESCVRDARDYVTLAERKSGRIPRPAGLQYIWGDALVEFTSEDVDGRIINLETSITRSADCWPDKGIHYRMNPLNIGCLTVARIDACTLANNHVLDWGYGGLSETIRTLNAAGIAHAGAGANAEEAAAPAVLEIQGKGRVVIFSFGTPTSGIPRDWKATAHKPGVQLLETLSPAIARERADAIRLHRERGDVVIASMHWGGNWGHSIPPEHIEFAHLLVEAGASVVHGHSSHHAKGFELHARRLILYGCGDFINDYEGIEGYERFRGDIAVLYVVRVDRASGNVLSARMVPFMVRRFRLHRAGMNDSKWLRETLLRASPPCLGDLRLTEDAELHLLPDWPKQHRGGIGR
jgi:poly-gamma-glutamate capsule biosynthesis protein CapA/YwtB (metallophosphatase superfamily)